MPGAPKPILITFAIPHESSDLRRHRLGDTQCQILHTGIGLKAAAATLKEALEEQSPELVISAGFAGGLDPALRVADLVADSSRSDPRHIARLPATVRRGAFLSTEFPLETTAAKETSFRDTGAVAVDMETAAIAEACARASVPALFVRAISDAANDEIPLPFPSTYDIDRQRPRPLALCLALLRAPSKIPRFARFLRDLRVARTALTRTLVDIVAGYHTTR